MSREGIKCTKEGSEWVPSAIPTVPPWIKEAPASLSKAEVLGYFEPTGANDPWRATGGISCGSYQTGDGNLTPDTRYQASALGSLPAGPGHPLLLLQVRAPLECGGIGREHALPLTSPSFWALLPGAVLSPAWLALKSHFLGETPKQNWKAQDSCEGVPFRVALVGPPTGRVCKNWGLVLCLYLSWIWAYILGLFLSVPLHTCFLNVD